MKNSILIPLITILVILIVFLSISKTALAHTCNILQLTTTTPNYKLNSAVHCKHGRVRSKKLEEKSQFLEVENIGFFGPDCTCASGEYV